MTPIGGSAQTLSYDLNGNLTGDGSTTYAYDATNRLLSISGFVTASYGYDALDRRSSKTAGGTTTRFLHAGSDEIGEYTSAGALLRRYVPGPGTDERAAMIDSGAASPPATAIKYPHTDRQGSVMAVTDSTGAVSERFAYDGFGRSNSALSGYPFRYTGQRLDFESGLMFYKARVYSTSLGRFLQTDPIGTKDDLNLYAYVGNDPVNATDPSGACFDQCPISFSSQRALRADAQARMDGGKPINDAFEAAEGPLDAFAATMMAVDQIHIAAAAEGVAAASRGLRAFLGSVRGAVETVKAAQVEAAAATRIGYGVNDPPARIAGAWTDVDLRLGLQGKPPASLGSPHLHHADQMPGSGIHEILPSEHMTNPTLHLNRWNQGVTDAMRQQDRQLHWWYRAQEEGAWQRFNDIYD